MYNNVVDFQEYFIFLLYDKKNCAFLSFSSYHDIPPRWRSRCKSVRHACGRLGVRIPAATNLTPLKADIDSSAAKRSETGASVMVTWK